MKLAILGTGMIVKEALPVLAAIEGIELTAILSTPRSLLLAQDIAKNYQIATATSDYREILTSHDVDTVYIATPNHTHYHYAKAAIQAGKHVICEKPFTLKLAELEQLAELARAHQVFLLEAITTTYLPQFGWIKKQLSRIGPIKLVTCQFNQYSSRYDAFKRGEIAPVFNPEMGGGALRDLNCYNSHLAVGLFGKPVSVAYYPNIERGVDTSGVLVLDYGDFKTTCIAAKDSYGLSQTVIQGELGLIDISGPANSLPAATLKINGGETENVSQSPFQHRMTAEFTAFEQMIHTNNWSAGQKCLSHSLKVMAVLDQASQRLTDDG